MLPTRLIGILTIVFGLLIQALGFANPVSPSLCDAGGFSPLAKLQSSSDAYDAGSDVYLDYELFPSATMGIPAQSDEPKRTALAYYADPDCIVLENTPSRAPLVEILEFLAAETTVADTGPFAGQKLYRVYGGDSAAGGASWSPVNPGSVANYRDEQVSVLTIDTSDGFIRFTQ